jgi:putative transposase
VQGFSWHVTQRGVNRCAIFKTRSDYQLFLSILRYESERHGFQVHAYTLMRNHVHVLGTPECERSMPDTMQAVGRRYVPFFNTRHQRSGALWQGRYKPALVHDERYWLTCMRYVELNAVRAGIVTEPEKYRWSSYLHHGLGTDDDVITDHPLYLSLGASPDQRQHVWRGICGHEVPENELDRLRLAMRRGILMSDPPYPESE